jgi:hypothetical protein
MTVDQVNLMLLIGERVLRSLLLSVLLDSKQTAAAACKSVYWAAMAMGPVVRTASAYQSRGLGKLHLKLGYNNN